MMIILVTGGAGYIGSHTCKELASLGHGVVVLDNLSTGHREFVRWGDFVHGDIRDTGLLRKVLRRIKPDGVIHFAASAYVGESVTDPGKYFHNNVYGTLCLLDAMRDEGVARIVVSGTCAVYGSPEKVPISEDCPTVPVNPYGASKLFMERMLADYRAAHGLDWISLRYFNAAGSDPEGEVGERHEPETHLVPRALMAARGDLPALDVFGDDYPTADGTCIRDYVHVSDLADAHARAITHLARGGESMALNLGAGHGWSVKQIVAGVEAVTGRRVPVNVSPRRLGDPPCLVADAANAKSILGWEARRSSLEHMVGTAWDWIAG